MSYDFSGIVDLIEKEVAIYCEYAEVSKTKTDIIQRDDLKALDSLLKIEQVLVMKIARLESKRDFYIKKFKNKHNISGPVDSGLLEDSMDYATKKKLDSLKDRFLEKYDEQQLSNELNEKLLKSKLEYVNFVLSRIDNKYKEDKNYSNNIDDNEVYKIDSIFDTKV